MSRYTAIYANHGLCVNRYNIDLRWLKMGKKMGIMFSQKPKNHQENLCGLWLSRVHFFCRLSLRSIVKAINTAAASNTPIKESGETLVTYRLIMCLPSHRYSTSCGCSADCWCL